MIFEQFAIISCYGADTTISANVEKIRAECRKISPTVKKPKLGNHTTSFPTLYAPPDEMRYLAIGLGLQDALMGEIKSERNQAKIEKLDFFRNPNSDALILRVALSQEYKDFITFWRGNLQKFTKWKFPPLGDTYNPHICVGEEKGLYEKIGAHRDRLEKLVQPISFYLPSPKVMLKVGEGEEGYWTEFNPMHGL